MYPPSFSNTDRFAKCASCVKPDGTTDGRSDIFPAGQSNTCTAAALPPTDFETQYRNNNARFRIPLQLFGLGILDGIQDQEIIGATTRLPKFAHNLAFWALPIEAPTMGVTNDVFPQAVDEANACTVDKSEPNDILRNNPTDIRNQSFSNPLHEIPDWLMFAIFMRFLDEPQPVAFSAARSAGNSYSGPTQPLQALVASLATRPPWLRRRRARQQRYKA